MPFTCLTRQIIKLDTYTINEICTNSSNTYNCKRFDVEWLPPWGIPNKDWSDRYRQFMPIFQPITLSPVVTIHLLIWSHHYKRYKSQRIFLLHHITLRPICYKISSHFITSHSTQMLLDGSPIYHITLSLYTLPVFSILFQSFHFHILRSIVRFLI